MWVDTIILGRIKDIYISCCRIIVFLHKHIQKLYQISTAGENRENGKIVSLIMLQMEQI